MIGMCPWCNKALGDQHIFGYCSEKCAREARADMFNRTKMPGEKWPRFAAEIPPEIAEMIDAASKKNLGVNVSAFSRANVVRSALRMYLDAADPLPEPAIDATAEDDVSVLTLEPGDIHEHV